MVHLLVRIAHRQHIGDTRMPDTCGSNIIRHYKEKRILGNFTRVGVGVLPYLSGGDVLIYGENIAHESSASITTRKKNIYLKKWGIGMSREKLVPRAAILFNYCLIIDNSFKNESGWFDCSKFGFSWYFELCR